MALYKHRHDEARAAAQEFGIPACSDLQELLANPQVDAVYITSANCDHEAQAVASARTGRHVLIEKPMAVNASACRRIIKECHQANVKLMVAQTLRFSPAVQQLHQWLEEKRLGQIISAQVTFTYDGTKSPRNWLYNHHVAGGGALMDIGVHCLDTLRFLLGEVEQASGTLQPDNVLCERSAQVELRFTSGAAGRVDCSYEQPYRSRLEIMGDRGRAWVDSFTLPWTQVTLNLESQQESLQLPVDTGNPYGALLESFSNSIRHNNPISIPGTEGLKNQEIIDLIYSDNGRPDLCQKKP